MSTVSWESIISPSTSNAVCGSLDKSLVISLSLKITLISPSLYLYTKSYSGAALNINNATIKNMHTIIKSKKI